MIIRSGLIQNRSGVDPDAFDRHWREVHGPLAALLPNLRGYVQNHVIARLDTLADTSMHRIDGISQLWFDDVPSMVTGMDSPENEACVRDISGFLDNVTLFVQKPGRWNGDPAAAAAKLMAVYIGGMDGAAIKADLSARLGASAGAGWRYRVNLPVGGDFIVDPSVSRSQAPVAAILEAWCDDEGAAAQLLSEDGWTGDSGPRPAVVLAVAEHRFLQPPE